MRLTENGWIHYHTYDSRRSVVGFPDTHALQIERVCLLWAELKMPGKRPTKNQRRWLGALKAIARIVNPIMGRELMIVRLWYPTDRREILRTIRGR